MTSLIEEKAQKFFELIKSNKMFKVVETRFSHSLTVLAGDELRITVMSRYVYEVTRDLRGNVRVSEISIGGGHA